MTAATFRRLALDLPEGVESPAEQARLLAAAPAMFAPAAVVEAADAIDAG